MKNKTIILIIRFLLNYIISQGSRREYRDTAENLLEAFEMELTKNDGNI